ncbi:hypothetical protein D3C87_1833880 [compost metagenome]
MPDTALSTPLPRESTENRVLSPLFVVETSTESGARALREQAGRAFNANPSDAWLLDLGWKLAASELR